MAAHLTLESIQFNGNAVPTFAQGPGPGPGYSAGGYSGRVPSMSSNAGPAPAEYEGYGPNAHGGDHAGGRHDKAPMGNVAPQGRGKQGGQTPPRGYGRAPLHPGKQVSGVTDGGLERDFHFARRRFAETSCLQLTACLVLQQHPGPSRGGPMPGYMPGPPRAGDAAPEGWPMPEMGPYGYMPPPYGMHADAPPPYLPAAYLAAMAAAAAAYGLRM
jgi:hypothetical protein